MSMEQVEKIVKKINEDAEAEASKILNEARTQAEKIKRDANVEADEIYSEILPKYEREAEQEKQRIVANAKLRARKAVLDAREDVIKLAFNAAGTKLQKLPKKDYTKVLEKLILEGVEAIDADTVVIARKEDSRAITSALLKRVSEKTGFKVTKAREYINAMGGVVLRSSDGKIEVNNTFETRLERFRDELRKEVAEVLFS